MEIKDLAWDIFKQSGNVNDYLLYNQLTNKVGYNYGNGQNSGNSSQKDGDRGQRQNAQRFE